MMYNSQITKDRIRALCKAQNLNVKQMLEDCSLGANAIQQINNAKGMSSYSLAKIADYLHCSVDYLLGRDLTESQFISETYPTELKPHIIAYIDLLGTKNNLNINKSNESSTLKMYQKLYTKVKELIFNLSRDKNMPADAIKFKIFSDNIVFAIEYTEDTLCTNASLLIAMISMIQYGFALDDVPMRGGICIGNLYMNSLFVIGEGLVKAHELESKNAFFQRIIIDPGLARIVLSAIDSNQEQCSIKFDFDAYPFLNYLIYAGSEDDIKKHYNFLNNAVNESSSSKDRQKNNWAKYYHNLYCKENHYTNYTFDNITIEESHDYNFTFSNSYTNSHNTISGNNNIIGNGNSVGKTLSEHEAALIDIFKNLDVVKQAQLLTYAAELEKEV